jgi:hypothetical protein
MVGGDKLYQRAEMCKLQRKKFYQILRGMLCFSIPDTKNEQIILAFSPKTVKHFTLVIYDLASFLQVYSEKIFTFGNTVNIRCTYYSSNPNPLPAQTTTS